MQVEDKVIQEKEEVINRQLGILSNRCKKDEIDHTFESTENYFLLKTEKSNIFLNLTYLKHSDSYSLTIDIINPDELVSTTCNPYTKLDEMMFRIYKLISNITDKSILPM